MWNWTVMFIVSTKSQIRAIRDLTFGNICIFVNDKSDTIYYSIKSNGFLGTEYWSNEIKI